MEHCGERLRKRGVANEDRISGLPEALILHILSLLPTKYVIATSVLSKRWRSVWKMVPKLEFDSYSINIQRFCENVSRSLLSHTAPVLESLSLKIYCRCDAINVGVWIGIAFARHVRELELDLNSFEELVRFPSGLFISNTLETLKLDCCILLDASTTVCLKSLRTLHLKASMKYKEEGSFGNLISGCPNLENLLIHRPCSNGIVNCNISVPSLKTLSIKDFSWDHKKGGFVINTPSLRVLNIETLRGSKYFQIENASQVVEASISDVFEVDNNIWRSIKSVKRLSLGLPSLDITYHTGVIFYQLVYLEIDTHIAEWLDLLWLMLDSSPKLQVLKLIHKHRLVNKQNLVGGKRKEPKHVPECLLSHLETFVWIRYDWERLEEEKVATYILRNARRLKNAKFSTRPIPYKELNKLEDRYRMLMKLDGVPRASDSCHLEFVE